IVRVDFPVRPFRLRCAGKSCLGSRVRRFSTFAIFHNACSKTVIHGKPWLLTQPRFTPKENKPNRRNRSSLPELTKLRSSLRLTRKNEVSTKRPNHLPSSHLTRNSLRSSLSPRERAGVRGNVTRA